MVFSLSEWINNSGITFCNLIIYDLNLMRNLKKNTFEIFFCTINGFKNLPSFCNILTLSKAFYIIPHFENLGYQLEIVYIF